MLLIPISMFVSPLFHNNEYCISRFIYVIDFCFLFRFIINMIMMLKMVMMMMMAMVVVMVVVMMILMIMVVAVVVIIIMTQLIKLLNAESCKMR